MILNEYFKSIVDQDRTSIVICDLSNTIIYMNPAAIKNYEKHGNLINKSILDCHNEKSKDMILKVVDYFKKSKDNNYVHTFYNEKQNKDVYMIALRDENKKLIGYYEKHEFRNIDSTSFYDGI